MRLWLAAWGVTLATLAMVAAHIVHVASSYPDEVDGTPLWIEPFIVLALLAPLAVGFMIAVRRPRNLIAWILLLGPFSLALASLPLLLLSEGWALQFGRATWPLLYAWPIAIAFVFPNGRLLSPRWRWPAGATAFCFTAFIGMSLVDPSPYWEPNEGVSNPLGGNAVGELVAHSWVWVPLWLGVLASLLAGAAAIRFRLLRSTGVQRLQVLWLAWTATLIPIGLLLCGLTSLALGDSLVDWVLWPFMLLIEAAIAVAVGVGVARYRLYAIERLVNRTVVYVVLTVLLASAYAGVTLLLGVGLGRDSAWVTAAATLAATLAFRPLRSLVQRRVDRRFSRATYEALRLVRAFEDDVRENRRAPEEIGGVLAEALGDPLAELLFWLPASEAYADAAGRIARLPEDERAPCELQRDGTRTAVLLHDATLLDRRELLDGVLAAASLSVEIARLRVEVRLQLAEVEASRARIVEAGYEERRRLERDLHDGAQQRLVSLGLRLRRMQRSLPREASVLSPAFDQTVDEVGAAIADLRQIAAGVRPARLDEGLAAALSELAASSPLRVSVDAPVERTAASVEAAAYFVVCEALTNAVKHAHASVVDVRASRANGALVVSISDDGVGGAVPRRGSGLAGLRDRVAAHGGTLTVTSPLDGGTRVEVAIPCES